MNNIIVPSAPAFLDPLIEIDSCYYYSVPKFFSFSHPNTRWLITMIRSKEEDRVKRKMEMNPELFKGRYFQMMDYPRLYMPHDPSVTPMFKRQSVLYLTALGMSLYLRSLPLIDLILFHKDPYDAVVGDPNEPQFASHLQDLKYGDFHAFPPCVIMLRMYCFEGTCSLLQAGWNPTLPLALPMRRKFERRAFYFYDWLEMALGLLGERPLYPLQSLILNITRNMTLYKYLMLPLTTMLPPTPKQRQPTGLIDVEELPVGTRMIGVRSLLEMAEDYDRYLQMRSCALEVAALKREAESVGLNPEILMIQAQDYDGYVADKEAEEANENNNVSNSSAWRGGGVGRGHFATRHWAIEHDTRLALNANNSAAAAAAAATAGPLLNRNASAKKAAKSKGPLIYASEGCRVMHYAMEKDKTCKRMQVCLDSLIVMTKRGFYVNGERLAPETPRARDTRNIIVLVLNMIQREQEKLDVIFFKIQSGYKKFQHLEEHKLLENRRLASVFNITKMVAALTRILLHSKELVGFVTVEFPPYPATSVDIKLNEKVQTKFNDIKCGVIQEFNSITDGWTYLNKEMLQEVANIKAMQLHFRVGDKPSAAAILEAKKAARKSAMRNKGSKNKSNMSNTNSCFVTFKKIQRQPSRRPSNTRAVADSAMFGTSGGCGGGGLGCDDEVPLGASSILESFDEPTDAVDPVFDFEDDRLPFLQSSSTRTDSATDQFYQDCQHDQQQHARQHQQQHLLNGRTADGSGDQQADDGYLLDDIAEECKSLSETELLMSSLCREVHEMLRPRGDTHSQAVTSLSLSTQHFLQSADRDDEATIEPEPGSHKRCINTGSNSTCASLPSPGDQSQRSQRFHQPFN